jgi:alpha-beta hydrolase superfamily lysophospholipase
MALPLGHWSAHCKPPRACPRGVIIGLHGFNDTHRTFATAGPWWAAEGFEVYAYDQRGFGGSAIRGDWGGGPAMAKDLLRLAALLRQRYPSAPLVVVGESMGGAVALSAAEMAQNRDQNGEWSGWADGLALAAPAVWGRDTMPWLYRAAMEVVVRIAPSLALSGKGLNIWPTDNIEMLRGLSKDPGVIKKTRTIAVYGLSYLMDHAATLSRAGDLRLPILWLYGARDELIPPEATYRAAKGLLRDPARQRLVVYGNGWHMLLRDLQSEIVLADIAAFVDDPAGPLPFGRAIDLRADTFAEAYGEGD